MSENLHPCSVISMAASKLFNDGTNRNDNMEEEQPISTQSSTKNYRQLGNIESKGNTSHNVLGNTNGKLLNHIETGNMDTEKVSFSIYDCLSMYI